MLQDLVAHLRENISFLKQKQKTEKRYLA